jgi:hypothetical protein
VGWLGSVVLAVADRDSGGDAGVFPLFYELRASP